MSIPNIQYITNKVTCFHRDLNELVNLTNSMYTSFLMDNSWFISTNSSKTSSGLMKT